MPYTLIDGVAQNQAYPLTFHIPSKEEKDRVVVGQYVKLAFRENEKNCERMWVKVTARDGDKFVGYLDNDPYNLTGVKWLDIIEFESRNIINIG